MLDKQAQIAVVDRRIRDLEAERRRIVEDQQRLRENMKALRGARKRSNSCSATRDSWTNRKPGWRFYRKTLQRRPQSARPWWQSCRG